MDHFITKHSPNIVGTLECFDRIIFKGHLPINYPAAMEDFLNRRNILIKDFKPFVLEQSERLKAHAKAVAQRAGRPFLYQSAPGNKEELIGRIIKEDRLTQGLICVLSTVETCSTFKLVPGEGRPGLKSDLRKCLFYYFYFLDKEFGRIHVRLQSWFPFQIQVYINGHEWLAKKMSKHGLSFLKADNAFLQIDDLKRAQRFADGLVRKHWPRILAAFARRVNPLTQDLLAGMSYYWVTDQAEFSTDILFKDAAGLERLYEKLLHHATVCFSAEDVLTFLGRKLHPLFKGDVLNEFKTRHPGARIKHRLNENWIKMYNKHGRVLRIETVINQPKEFKTYRFGQRQGCPVLGWFPMRKGVADFYRYAEVARAANRRYLDALSVVDNPAEAQRMLDQLVEPAPWRNRKVRGFNPFQKNDLALFTAAIRGEHCIHGFRNRDLTEHLFADPIDDPKEVKRRIAKVTRLIQLLRAHGLIAKIPRARRYRPTLKGLTLMTAAICWREETLPIRIHKKAS